MYRLKQTKKYYFKKMLKTQCKVKKKQLKNSI